jgi:uncharacterized protein YjbI with pentapeptide repeats
MILNKATKIGLTKGIKLRFYQNDFNYAQFDGFTLENCSIHHTAIGTSRLTDLNFLNFRIIENSSFTNSTIDNCVFSNVKIENTSFAHSLLENCTFDNVSFNNAYFVNTEITSCIFSNCNGLEPHHFYGAYISSDTKLPDNITAGQINKITPDDMRNIIAASKMADYRKKELLEDLKLKSNE